MKKMYVMTILAACAMMMCSCKNNSKENESVVDVEVVEDCCGDAEACEGCEKEGDADCCNAEAEVVEMEVVAE